MNRLNRLPGLGQYRFFNCLWKVSLVTGLTLTVGVAAQAQQPSNQPLPQDPARLSRPAQTPKPKPSPQATPGVGGPMALPPSSPSPTPPVSLHTAPAAQDLNPLTLDEALRLANIQASGFQQAGLNERIAAEDVRQAQVAFFPRITLPTDYIYTTPLIGAEPGTPRGPSFISADAISRYQAIVNLSGDVDIAGRLRATLEKNRALLAAAHAGTEVARQALALTLVETYYGLGLATAERRAAEQNLAAAEEFERITSLLLSGGEVAPVDLTRAQLQTTTRRDELERARASEAIAAGALRVLVGYDFLQNIATTDLAATTPLDNEIDRLTADMISRRPEFAQFEAQRRAAEQDIRLARAERRPQLSYSISGGFDTDSLGPVHIKEHSGAAAAFSLSIPIFDWGASRSHERQARLRAELAESQRAQALRGFAEAFYSARAQAVSAVTRIRLAATGIVLAENNLNASIARYRTGEAQIIEVTDAQTTLVSQRAAFYQALFDYQTALARLRRATGR